MDDNGFYKRNRLEIGFSELCRTESQMKIKNSLLLTRIKFLYQISVLGISTSCCLKVETVRFSSHNNFN